VIHPETGYKDDLDDFTVTGQLEEAPKSPEPQLTLQSLFTQDNVIGAANALALATAPLTHTKLPGFAAEVFMPWSSLGEHIVT